MKKTKKVWKKTSATLFLFFLMIASTALCYAKTTVLTNSETDNSESGIIFETGEYSSPGAADLFFIGIEDKIEGLESPYIYADNLGARIAPKENGKECSELAYTENYLEVEAGREYCSITKDGNRYAEIELIEYADDWSSAKIRWNLLGDEIHENEDNDSGEKSSSPESLSFVSNKAVKITLFMTLDILFLSLIIFLAIRSKKYA